MKINIVYLLLIALLGITVSASVAQQNQNVPKTVTEVEALKIQLQTVENEKMEIETKLAEAQAKHAEANAKLINTEFGKLKLELKDYNQQWLITWIVVFFAFLSAGGIALWRRLIKNMDDLIEDRIEDSLNGFKKAVEQVKILEKEHAVSVLDFYDIGYPTELEQRAEAIKALSGDMLLDIFSDKTRDLGIRWAAADVLVAMKSARLVSPMLTFLNSIVISNIDTNIYHARFCDPHIYWDWLSRFCNEKTYQGLKDFLNRLIKEDSENKDSFLTWTVFLLAQVSLELDLRDSDEMLREVIPDLKELEQDEVELITLAKYFDKFNEPEGIKEILTNGLTDNMPDVEKQCLELLQEHDPDFVNEWKAQKEDTNTESEDIS